LYVLLDSEQKHYYLLNFAREFLRIIFFSCELFKFANICWPEGGGAGAIDFTTKKYVGKIDNFLLSFFS